MINPIRKIFIGDLVRLSMDWVDKMKPEINAYPAIVRDKIVASTWAVDADSPVSDVVMSGADFDDDLHVAWVSVEAGASIVDGDVLYINNTIETAGLQPNGLLSKATSTQRIIRQYRIRFVEC